MGPYRRSREILAAFAFALLFTAPAAAEPMFQVQVPGIFRQDSQPVRADAGSTFQDEFITRSDSELAIADRGALAAFSTGTFAINPGQRISVNNLFSGGFGRAEFLFTDVVFSGPLPDGSTIDASLNLDLSLSLSTSALHSVSSDGRINSVATTTILGTIVDPSSGIGGSFRGGAQAMSNHLGNGTLTSSLNRDGAFGTDSVTFPDESSVFWEFLGGFTTDPLTIVIGRPMNFDLSLVMSGGTTFDGSFQGGDSGRGEALLADGLSFSSSGPVFNLPPGFTVDSPSGLIVDNHFVAGAAVP